MIYLITGTSASGKSEYAENIAVSLYDRCGRYSGGGGLYYIAAMKPFGDEAARRILRHRKLRDGKGFETIECYTHLEKLSAGGKDVFLIECVSNLLANEIYDETGSLGNIRENLQSNTEEPDGERYADRLRSAIIGPVLSLARRAAAVVIVTNDVSVDGRHFEGDEAETEQYCRMLGKLNIMLAEEADVVAEVVCGIPYIIKGSAGCEKIVGYGNGE